MRIRFRGQEKINGQCETSSGARNNSDCVARNRDEFDVAGGYMFHRIRNALDFFEQKGGRVLLRANKVEVLCLRHNAFCRPLTEADIRAVQAAVGVCAMKIFPASDSSLLVIFGDVMSPALHRRVMTLFRAFQRLDDSRVRNLHPAYGSLLIDFDPLRLTHDELTSLVEQLVNRNDSGLDAPVPTVTIPVCYEAEFGPDLRDVAEHAGVSQEDVVRLHSSPTYFVYFLGFAPGFPYLGGLPETLHTPRLATPRQFVAGGSVGIAGSQTGIYPLDSPGGWRLIGRTPLRMFDPDGRPPTRLRPGEAVKFLAIDRGTFDKVERSAEAQLRA